MIACGQSIELALRYVRPRSQPLTMTMMTSLTYRKSDLLWLAGVAVLYALLAKAVLAFYSSNGMVTIFWPGAGLGLGILLLHGMKFWPGVYVGAVLGGLWTGHTLGEASLISLGSVLESLLGAWLLCRKGKFNLTLASIRDYFRLFLLASVLSPSICALIGIGTLLAWGRITPSDAHHEFIQWWQGDTLGIVLITPLLLVWRHPPDKSTWHWPEALLVLGAAFLTGQIIFLDWFSEIFSAFTRGYWLYLIICWAAIRLRLHGVVLITLITAIQALVGSAQGLGYFGADSGSTRMINFWAYTITLSITGAFLAIVLCERERIAAAQRSSENRYQLLFENMLDGVAHCRMFFWDTRAIDFEFISVNANYEYVTGLKDVVGRKISEIIPHYADNNQISLDNFAKVVLTGQPARWEHYLAENDRWFSFSAYRPAANEFICHIENITERKRTEEELSKLSLAITQSSVSIVITDLDARIQYVNPAFTRVSGYSPQEAIQQNPRILQSSHTPRQTYQAMWAALCKGETWRGEFINRRKDGSEYIEDAIISPLRQPNGQITHYVGVKTDVTELKQAINQLRVSEERFLQAQQAANLGVFDYKTRDGHIAWDANTWKFWGFEKNEPASFADFMAGIHPDDRAWVRRTVEQLTDPASQGQFQIGFRVSSRADHSVRHIMASGRVFFEEGKASRAIGILRDISIQKHLEKKIQTQRSEMEGLVNQQVAAQTAAAIAHELNQPLVAISAYSETALRILQEEIKNPRTLQQALEGAIEQAQRAGRTLHELLDFLHQGDVVSERVDLNEVVQSALSLAEESGYGGFHAVVTLEPGLPAVQANRLQLQKVLLNLFHNGVEAMRNAGAPVSEITISVKTMAEKNMAQVTIQDRGPGLDAEEARRIFDPFFTTKPSGIGLGLAISRSLIEAHGGQLWADLDAGPGATFHFVLPFAS